MHTKNILILGAAGFLGANMVRRCLAEEDVAITAVDSLDPYLGSTLASLEGVMNRITFIQGDIRDESLLRQVIPKQDIIFNCAAQTSHPRSFQDPVFDAEVNCIGNLRVLSAIRDYAPDAVIVYPSSSTVVGKATEDVIDESHGEKPLDIYSANKGVAEKYYRIFHTAYDLKTVVLRFANLYGPFGKQDAAFGFANYFIHLAAHNGAITLYGDGGQRRNLMFVHDATDVMWLAAHTPSLIGESYFAVHDDHHSIREIAEIIVSVFERGTIKTIPWPDLRKRIEIDNVLLSSARLYALTGWKPKYSLREGLEATRKFYLQEGTNIWETKIAEKKSL